eukprot:TRINITY_DN5608_c0_g1_i1.p1 TRINITY_DN5608_c0_g1~~TRINITY_DN5608_c0_g1_i1.p1  ORF type:complete len:434 (-),score=140.11 TRINITY_DN5608_c0_g1_i1:102-1403(-)
MKTRLFFSFLVFISVVNSWGTFKWNPLLVDDYEYGIMLDAGSSSTKLHIYTWPKRENKSLPIVQSAPIGEVSPWYDKVKPGISSYKDDPESAGASLTPLINYAIDKIPINKQQITPIYLFATAGMRLLDEDSQKKILDSCAETLAASPFLFNYETLNMARVISGEDEGVYGWITVNYLSGTLQEGNIYNTLGALDLGGASTQITFVPQNVPKENGYTLVLANVEYPLYAYSYLGYGNDQARELKDVTLIQDNSFPTLTNDGCLPTPYEENVDIESSTYTLRGSSSFYQCLNESVRILFKDKSCSLEPCSFDGVYQPALRGDFLAFSAYVYNTDFFGLPSDSGIKKLGMAGKEFCNLTYDELKKYYIDNPSWDFITTYCFLDSYVISLLTEGFGFPIDEESITFKDNIDNIEIGWALGAMLDQVDHYPLFKNYN